VTVTLVDTTPPVLSLPGSTSVEAAGPDGAVVTFSATAADNLDGAVPVQCQPTSGSTFVIATTTVTCRAADTRNNEATGSFAVNVVDTTAPDLAVPAALRIEANGPSGARVPFTVEAVDSVDGPIAPTAITCSPASNSMFPLGSTQVSCSVVDQRGNAASRGFVITVVDSAPPVVAAPAPLVIVSSSPVSADDPRVRAYLASARATDLVDPAPRVSTDVPAVLPLGTTTVTFTASDGSGNRSSATSTIRVVEQMPATPPAVADRTPPANVRDLRAEAGNLRVRLRWVLPDDSDFGHVEVQRSPNVAEVVPQKVYAGVGRTFVDRALTAGEAYRYLVVAYDRTGNRSAGVAIVVVAKATALVSPLDGARLSGPPTFQWTRARGAAFYNLQVFRGTRKVLSVWPRTTTFKLPRTWRSAGRRERLTPGAYQWYVWPATSRGAYGRLHVSGSFSVR
jgi:hypothetical protein